jgi:rubrerythrin
MGLSIDFAKLKPHDVLDLAIFAEAEAQDNYDQLSTILRSRGNDHAADFFHRMAALEKLHHDQLKTRRNELFPGVAPGIADRWFWGIEAPDYAAVGPTITTREAYSFALASEERAFEYYQQAIEFVSDATMVSLFEELRDAEGQHQKLLRGELERLGA